jgi:hypothetical protein
MLNNLGDAAGALADEVRADKEQRAIESEQRAIESARLVERQHRQNRRVLALLVAVAVLVAALTLMAVSNRLLNNQNKQIVERIESCTTAGGECYEESARRTGNVVATVIRADIYTARCLAADPTASDAAIEKCVLDRLKTPQPAPTAR